MQNRLTKIRSRLSLLRLILRIQRAWRKYKLYKKNNAAFKIQKNYKVKQDNVKYKSNLIIYIKRYLHIYKIKRWLRFQFKKQR